MKAVLSHLGGNVANNNGGGRKRRAYVTVPVGGGSNNVGDDHDGPRHPDRKKRQQVNDYDDDDDAKNGQTKGEDAPGSLAMALITDVQSTMILDPPSYSGGMLNAGLRNQYRVVQQEREKEKQNVASSVVEDDGIAASTDGCTRVAPNEDNDVVDMSNDPVIATPSKFTPCMPRKKKRLKKTPYKSLSSSSAAVASSSGARRTTRHDNDDGARAYRSPNFAPSPHPLPRPTERYNNLGGISPLL
ncbi:hypothetical protein ACHAW5_010082 [Stephanodiscus triporus]|uniref:Uncharacterized protein n=1 Tax=Stephanodiscus triporus TaxID=2934178 RepID=A0ABD3NR03_9STRA